MPLHQPRLNIPVSGRLLALAIVLFGSAVFLWQWFPVSFAITDDMAEKFRALLASKEGGRQATLITGSNRGEGVIHKQRKCINSELGSGCGLSAFARFPRAGLVLKKGHHRWSSETRIKLRQVERTKIAISRLDWMPRAAGAAGEVQRGRVCT
jgi:hypothetical protein